MRRGTGRLKRSALLAGVTMPRLAGLSEGWRNRRRATARDAAMLANRLAIETLEPRLLLAADAPPITGSIDVPGETDSFQFTLTQPKKIYFDSLTDNNALKWSLKSPSGAIVSNRGLGSSDSRDISGANVLDLQVGTYTLSVDGDAATTGTYGFRLLDLADAQGMTPGERIAVNNPGRETDLYRFDAAEGDSFFFDRSLLSSGDASWRLIGPDGEYIRGPDGFGDSGVFTIGRSGGYTLAIEGRDSNASAFDYAFTLAPVRDTRETLTIGDTVSGAIAAPGSTVTYAFTLATDTRLLFDTLLRSDGYRWTLTGPRGTVVANRALLSSDSYDGDPALNLLAGDYTLRIAADGDRVGSFAFRLLDPAQAPLLSAGDSFGGAVGDAGLLDDSPREPGAPIDYAALPGAANRSWDVAARGELTVADDDALRPARLTLEAWINAGGGDYYQGAVTKTSGTGWSDGYGLVRVGDTIRFFVNYWDGPFVEAPLAQGNWQHVAGTYDGATLKLYVDGALAAESEYAEAITHSGNTLALGASPAGAYQLNGSLDDVRVWNVARTAEEIAQAFAAPLTGGEAGLVGYWRFDEETGTTTEDVSPRDAVATAVRIRSSETKLYRFSASAGDHVFLDLTSRTGDPLYVRVYAPDGRVLTGPTYVADLDLVDLPLTGEYVVAVEGRVYNLDPASFDYTVRAVSDDTALLATDAVTTGRIEPGQRDRFTFTLASATKLVFDSLTDAGNLRWSLTGPRGSEVANRAFYYSDGAEYGAAGVLDLPAGGYVLTVEGDGDTARDYAFRLLNIAAAVAVPLDAEIAGRIDPARETDAYAFAAQAGDQILLERIVGRNQTYDYWRLIDPTGRDVAGPTYFGDDYDLPITMTGTYTLLVESPVWDEGVRDYSFRLNKTGFVAPPDLS